MIEVCRQSLSVIHCPGHTTSHVVFYHQQLIDSICDKLWPLGNEVEFICGHGPNSTFGKERTSNPLVGDRVTGRA